MRSKIDDSLAFGPPTPESSQVGFDPRFVEKNQSVRVNTAEAEEVELGTGNYDIGSLLFSRVKRFFLKLIRSFCKAFHRVPILTLIPSLLRSCSRVSPG